MYKKKSSTKRIFSLKVAYIGAKYEKSPRLRRLFHRFLLAAILQNALYFVFTPIVMFINSILSTAVFAPSFSPSVNTPKGAVLSLSLSAPI